MDRFDRRFILLAPDWADEYCQEDGIPYVLWNFERLNERSMDCHDPEYIAGKL